MKPVLWLWLAGPLVELLLRAGLSQLGANPQEALLRGLGQQTLMLMLLVLAFPVVSRSIDARLRPSLLACRRMLGLWTFAYATIHLMAYWQFEHDLRWSPMWSDLWTRPFVTLGVSAWAGLALMALTSNRWSMKMLKARWKQMHGSLIWPLAVLGLVHFYLHKAGKNDFGDPLFFTAAFLLVLALRRWWRRPLRA